MEGCAATNRTVWRLRTSRGIQEPNVAVRRAGEELSASLGRSPTVDDVAGYLAVSAEAVLEALDAAANQVPLSLAAAGKDWRPGVHLPPGEIDPGFDAVERA